VREHKLIDYHMSKMVGSNPRSVIRARSTARLTASTGQTVVVDGGEVLI